MSRPRWGILGKYEEGCDGSVVKNKETSKSYFRKLFLNRLQPMFNYQNLPDSIPQRDLKLQLHVNGYTIIAERDDALYAFWGGLGGEPNPYYMPTIATVANPALKFSENFKIDENCIVIPNDSLYMGMMPIIDRYAELLTEADITLRAGTILQRLPAFLTAATDDAKKEAEIFFAHLEAGDLVAMGDNAVMEGIKANPYGTSSASDGMKQMIELRQYYLANFWQELGINSNYNMKREAINESEAGLNSYALLPTIDDMLNVQGEAIEKVNKMFGTNWKIELGSSWADIHEEADHRHEEATEEVTAPETEEGDETETDEDTE